MVTMARLKWLAGASLVGAALFGTFWAAGCGDSNTPSPTAKTAQNTRGTGDLPTASIGSPAANASANVADGNSEPALENAAQAAGPAIPKGSPEWILGQMIVLLGEPLPANQSAQQQADRVRERNQKLIEMAHEVIAKTHKDKAAEPVFNKAVQFLAEARLQLATNGSQEDAQALHEDARALYRRDPASVAAADAAFAVARLAHTNAQLSRTDPRLIQEFAIQARFFASRFPKDARAVQLLSAAGQTCEAYHMDAEAVSCFALLRENFAQSPQAAQATAVLRRLELKGHPLTFGGETRDGNFLRIEDLRGKPVLIVFWASDSESFQAMMPRLNRVLQPYGKSTLNVLGVCLDESDKTLDEYVEKNRLSWTQIFYADPAKRHWEHPLVQFYGVHDIPSLWLVNADGVVVDTHVTPETLDGQLKYLLASDGHTTRE
jgi:peroxiredoxin